VFWCKVSVTFNQFKPKLKHILKKNSKFHENPFSGSRPSPSKATDEAILTDTPQECQHWGIFATV
jgi:hypothetical protein